MISLWVPNPAQTRPAPLPIAGKPATRTMGPRRNRPTPATYPTPQAQLAEVKAPSPPLAPPPDGVKGLLPPVDGGNGPLTPNASAVQDPGSPDLHHRHTSTVARAATETRAAQVAVPAH